MAVLLVALFAYEVLPFVWGRQLWGKSRLRLRVVDARTRGPISCRQALGRFLAFDLPMVAVLVAWSATFTVGAWGLLPMAAAILLLAIPGAMLRDPHKRGLHDRLAGTIVVVPRG